MSIIQLWISITELWKSIMDIHYWIMDIHNWMKDIHNWMKDIHNYRVYGLLAFHKLHGIPHVNFMTISTPDDNSWTHNAIKDIHN